MSERGEGQKGGQDEAALWAARFARASQVLSRLGPQHIGQSAKQEIARIGKARLYRYDGVNGGTQTGQPVLIVHGLVGRHTIVDLTPDRSVVQDMLARGLDVWVIDWGNPSPAERCLGLADYVATYLRSFVAQLATQTGQTPTLFGLCEGGVFALCFAALFPEKTRALALTITPVDAHADLDDEPGFLNHWVRGMSEAQIEAGVTALGNLPGKAMADAFQAMAPARAVAKWSRDVLMAAQDEETLRRFAAMETWLADRPDHPARLAQDILIGLYKRNDLVAGRMEIGGARVDLSAVTMPVLNIYALRDHIVPPACAAGLGAVVGSSDYTAMPMDAGHVGIFVSERCRGVVGGAVADWLEARC